MSWVLNFLCAKVKRLISLTEPGKELIGIVERLLLDAQNIKQLADQFTQKDQGQLVIATTHTQARYVLPKVVKVFKDAFPKVHLWYCIKAVRQRLSRCCRQARQISVLLIEALDAAPEIATFPYYQWRHALIVPAGILWRCPRA